MLRREVPTWVQVRLKGCEFEFFYIKIKHLDGVYPFWVWKPTMELICYGRQQQVDC